MFESHTSIVIGGGAAGIFCAICIKEAYPNASVVVLEKNAALLSKVKISGGGRCNVTHHCFDPKELTLNYPRGHKELRGPFSRFQPQDTIEWFEKKGVKLKKEQDNRVFPVTDSSQTIIDCLLTTAQSLGVKILTKQKVESVEYNNGCYTLVLKNSTGFECKNLVLATGSSSQGHQWASQLGHSILKPVPSLFTFNSDHFQLSKLSGIAVQDATVHIENSRHRQTGPVLITHFGFSGPCILKLSAWAARELFQRNYQFKIRINWLEDKTFESVNQKLLELKKKNPNKKLVKLNIFQLPKKLWLHKLEEIGCAEHNICDVSNQILGKLAQNLIQDIYTINGKATNKEEFVTCGGVSLKEVNFKTMESKLHKGLFFAGEILDIDGVTGGFNFQNAWTTAFIAAQSQHI